MTFIHYIVFQMSFRADPAAAAVSTRKARTDVELRPFLLDSFAETKMEDCQRQLSLVGHQRGRKKRN